MNSMKTMTAMAMAMAMAMVTWSPTALAADWNTDADGVAIGGYDVVAYHSQDSAVKGSKRHTASHEGATWQFSSAAHRDAFVAEPGRYLPAFQGWCAFAVAAKNATVPPNPETFKLYNGELLLFFNDLYEGQVVNTKVMWNADEQALHHKAETNWPSL